MSQAKNSQIPFNPSILTWARERAGYAIDEIAEKIKVKAEKISAWEKGELSPTVKQARNLAKLYQRPFLEFFAKEVPVLSEVECVPDFRFYNKTISKEESRELKSIQAWAESIRLNAIALLEEMAEEPRAFSHNLRFNYKDSPSQAAATLREAMGFELSQQLNIAKTKKIELPNVLRRLIEDMGVIVLRKSSMAKQNARGMCIYSDILPVIIYSSEAPSAQLFTLMHEFAHVVIGASAISSAPALVKDIDSQDARIEKWCNEFAASFLMPESAIMDIAGVPRAKVAKVSQEWLRSSADLFGVSRHAFLIRLITLGLVDENYYWSRMRQRFLVEESQYKPFGRSKYYGRRYVNEHGEFYVNLVLDAFVQSLIDAHNAANFLGIKKLEHFADIKSEARV